MSRIIESAIEWAVNIANDPSHGYDQINRWGPNYDCSSLVISAYEMAGLPIRAHGGSYTGNMKIAFTLCGFKAIPYKKGMPLIRGDVLLNEKHHTAMYIGDGKIVQASINEKGGIVGGKTGDQTGREISVGSFYEFRHGWDCILRYTEEEEEKEVITVNVELRQIQIGSKCAEVGTVQTLLNALGFKGKNGRPLTVDRDFGQNVDYAVRLFQKSKDVTPDGIVGPKTWKSLLTSF